MVMAFISISLYKRYIPVLGASYIDLKDLSMDKQIVVDIRNYNELNIHPIPGAINIPYAYLNRNFHEIPKNMDLVLVVSSTLDKNIGARFLRKKGFRVSGYTMISPTYLITTNSKKAEPC
ncbi:hypothetical protein A8F94_18845 [Bacillus sp. FJAT-27225]|nr:hypothetical protein A8F94_18845 [Bacillus sp. FJAT-27225]